MADFEFFGDGYHLRASDDCQMAMLDFADVAAAGTDSETLEGLAMVKRFLKDVIVEDEWQKFWASARKNRAQVQRDLMPIVVRVFQGETDRPTSRPSDSSAGPGSTGASSGGGSSSVAEGAEEFLRVARHWEDKGRPDVAYMVLMANGQTPSTA